MISYLEIYTFQFPCEKGYKSFVRNWKLEMNNLNVTQSLTQSLIQPLIQPLIQHLTQPLNQPQAQPITQCP